MWNIGAALLAIGLGTAQPPDATGLSRVAFLQGCWETTSASRVVEERWTGPRGGAMLGISRTVRDGRLVEYELVVLREQGSELAYEAHPSGQSTATFLSRQIGDGVAVFENPSHDFPQRVGYARRGADSLDAWVEGVVNGERRRQTFSYTRIACD